MDIQEAISYWQKFRAECFEMLKEGTENDKRTAENQIPVCDVTLSALQEQAEREKGCPLCHGERLKSVAIVNHWGEDQIALVSGKANEKEKFAFCPKCGRYLGDKND